MLHRPKSRLLVGFLAAVLALPVAVSVDRGSFREAVAVAPEGPLLIDTGSFQVQRLARTSPSGQWLVARAHTGSPSTANTYRSSDGQSWESIPFGGGLNGAGDVTIDDAGVLYAATHRSNVNSYFASLWRYDGSWTRVAEGSGRQYQQANAVAVSSSLQAVVQNNGASAATLLAKSPSATSFAVQLPLPANSTWQLSVVGDRAFLVGSVTTVMYQLGDSVLTTPVGELPTGNAQIIAAPGSTMDLIAVSVLAGTSVRVWTSSDNGSSWVETATTPQSIRGGVSLAQPQLTTTGQVQLVGFGLEGSSKFVYRERMDPLTGAWSGVERVEVATSATGLVAWPGLSLPSAGSNSPFMGLVHGANPYQFRGIPQDWEADAPSAFPSPSQGGVGFELSGNVPKQQVWAANGQWRVVVDRPTNRPTSLWRSRNGADWDLITVPPIFSYSDPVAIRDDGTIFVARWVRAGTCCSDASVQLFQYLDGWRGPLSTVRAGTWRFGPQTLDVAGEQIVITTAEGTTSPQSFTIRSIDGGVTWTSLLSNSVTSPASSLIDGDRAHLLSSSGSQAAVDFTAATVTKIQLSAGTVIGDGSADGTVRVIGSGTPPATALTTDGGSTWTLDQGFAGAPAGSRGLAASAASDGRIFAYDVAECTAARMVYSLSRDSSLAGQLAVTPLLLDESKTAVLIPNEFTTGASNQPSGPSVLVAVSPTIGTVAVRPVSGSLNSPEAVFGFDGYGITRRGVNTSTGNFTHSEVDASIAGVGPKLEVSRSYNSLDGRLGMFGRGWTSNFETRVYENCVTKDVTILHGDGRREYHYSNGAGGYVPAPGYTNRLVKTGTTGWTLNNTDGKVSTFRSDGRMTKVTDADGQALNLTWSSTASNATLTSLTDAVSGRQLSFTYAGGLVSSVSTSPVTAGGVTAPLTWNYVYSGQDLAEVCEPRNNNPTTGFCRTYTVENGAITTVTDANGNVDRKVGYSGGKVVWEENDEAQRTTFAYPTEFQSVVTDPNGNSTTTNFDSQRRAVSETNPVGGVTAYTYDSNGFRNTTTDPNGNVTTRTFDTNGNVLSETNGESQTQYFTYDQFNNVIESRDARSTNAADNRYRVTTTWSGVTRNRLSESTPPTAQQPSGTTRSLSYSVGTEPAIGGGFTPAGLLLSEIDAKGAATTYRYDSAGNLRKMTDRAALVTDYTYDELGRRLTTTVVSDTFPAGVVTMAGYDALGNIVRETGPPVANTVTGVVRRSETVTVFDPAGNVSTVTVSDTGGSASPDAARVTSYVYDRADRLVSTTDADGGVATQVNDGAGNVVSTVDEAGRRVDFGYDARNLQVSATGIGLVTNEGAAARNVSLGSTVYDAGGRPTESVDGLGRVTRTVYDRADRPVSVTRVGYVNRDGTSRDIVLEATTYDPAGFPVQVVTGGGRRTVAQAFDESGRQVTAVLDPAGLNRLSTTVYDANGNTVSSTLTAGGVSEQTRYSYDAADRVLSETVENGTDDLTTTYTYDRRGVATSRVEPRGNASGATAATFRVDYTADELGRVVLTQSPPVSVTDAGVTITGVRPSVRVGYDTFGSVTHHVDELGNTTTHRFDRLGREVEITHPTYTRPSTGVAVVPTELFGYDRVGNLTSRTDRRGRTTTFGFDGLNRVATQTDPAIGTNPAGVWRWFYDDVGNTITQIDPRGARIESTFDRLDRQRTATSVVRNATAIPDRYTTTFDYDDLNNTTYQVTPTGDITTATYSPASEQLTVTDPAGNVTTTSYDLAARPVTTVDPLGRRGTTTFDLAGRAVKTERFAPTGTLRTAATTGYDRAGNAISVTSPRGNLAGATAADFTTTFSFDPIGRLTTVVEPISATASITTSYAYDAAGNQTALTDGRGNTTQYGYNPWNLQSTVIEPSTTAHPNLADRTWTNEFDAGGLAVRSTEPGGVVVQRTFDELGRLIGETGAGATAAPTATRTFGYDAAGFMTQAASPTGTIGFSYDDRGLLTASTGPAAYAGTFSYDPSGRLTARSNASASTTIAWNSRSLPATVTDTLSATTATHTYDAAAQRISTAYTGGGVRSYGYDNLGRLTTDTLRSSTSVVRAGFVVGYDVDSNIVSRIVTLPGNTQAGANTYMYDNLGRITSWTKPATTTPLAYTWDAAGNLTNNAGQAQSFDQRNRMLTAGTTTYTWTPRSTMATQKVGTAAATTFTFDGLGRQTKSNAQTYTYDSLDRVATRAGTTFAYVGREIDPVAVGTTLFSRGANAEPVAAKIGTATASLIGLDPHGDASYRFVGNSTVSATRVYDPMGKTLDTTGTFTTIGFQGDYTDPTTADVWMGARWYRPGTGNFVSRDTVFGALDTPISLNRYTYAQGDPLGMWDPDGRKAEARSASEVCNAFGQSLSDDDLIAFADGGAAAGCAGRNADKVLRDAVPLVKSAAGFVPVLGDAIDLYDCARGDWLSCAAAVPLAGYAANTAKLARVTDNVRDAQRAVDTARTARTAVSTVRNSERAIDSASDTRRAIDTSADTRRTTSNLTTPNSRTSVNNPRQTSVAKRTTEPQPPRAQVPSTSPIRGSVATEAGEGLRPAVIGEKMGARVKPFAAEHGYETYPGMKDYTADLHEDALAHNRAQIEQWKSEGRQIFDVGPAPQNDFWPIETSDAYAMEHNIVRDYPGYTPVVLDGEESWIERLAAHGP